MKTHDMEQGSEAWHHIRKGKITGTYLKNIMGTPKARQEALYEIIAERLTVGVDMDYENPMERGTRLEPEARAMFSLETGKAVREVGFCEDEDNEFMGDSPDGLMEDDTECLEIKCPLGKNYVKAWLTNEVPDEYKWQVVQKFTTNGKLKKLYFALYNPSIPVHPLHIIEVTRESLAEEIKQARIAQDKFLGEVDQILKTIIKL